MSRLKYFLTAFLIVATSCGGANDAGVNTSAPPMTAPTVSSGVGDGEATTTTETVTTTKVPLAIDERLSRAIDSLLESDSYAFEVTVTISTQSEDIEMELEGWVQGSDRELLLRSGPDEVTTRVLDGVATVERAGETVEVPLEEASDAPTLDILRALRNVSSTANGEITGSLTAADLKDTGFDVNGTAGVTVTLATNGSLAGYMLTGTNGAWTVTTRFFDVGESFRSSG